MENEYMNVCVNAKPNTIILQSKPDEVTGGYADKDGVWHDFGGETIPTIKVYVGKGTSGTAIVDDTKRAITDPIPCEDEEHIYIEQYVPMGLQCSVKNCTSETEIDGTNGCVATTADLGKYNFYWTNISDGVYIQKSPAVYGSVSNSDGNIRFVYKVGSEGTADVTQTFDGYVRVSGKLYHLMSE